jgi:hypothetical protein
LLLLTKFSATGARTFRDLVVSICRPESDARIRTSPIEITITEAYIARLANPEINTPHGTALACGALPFSK